MQSCFLTTVLLALCAADSVLSIPLHLAPDAAANESKHEVGINAANNLANKNILKSEHILNSSTHPSKTPAELNDDENWIEALPLQRKIAKRSVARPSAKSPPKKVGPMKNAPSLSTDNARPKRKGLISYTPPKDKKNGAKPQNGARPSKNKVTFPMNPPKVHALPSSIMFKNILIRPAIGARQ